MPDSLFQKIQDVETALRLNPEGQFRRRTTPRTSRDPSQTCRGDQDPKILTPPEDQLKASRDPTPSTFLPRLPEGRQSAQTESLETRGPFIPERSARSPRRATKRRRTEFQAQEALHHVVSLLTTATKGRCHHQRYRAPSPLESSTLHHALASPRSEERRRQSTG